MVPSTIEIYLYILIGCLTTYWAVKQASKARRRAQFAAKHGCQAPHQVAVGGDPFVGVTFLLETLRRAKKNEYMQINLERYRKFGNTYVNKRLFFETVSTIDDENMKAICSSSFDSFQMPQIRVNALKPLFGDGIFLTDGAPWSHSRSLLRPIFSKQNMAPMLPRFERHFQLLLRNIPADGSTVDLGQLFYNLTLDISTEFLLGRSTNTLDPENSSHEERQFAEDYLFCCTEAVRYLQMGPLHFLGSNTKALPARERAWRYVNRYVEQVLEMREHQEKTGDVENTGEQFTFLQQLAGETADRDELRDQILNILLASRDTTASLLGNLFFMLARHPDVYAKLRAEVQEVVGRDFPTETHFKSMTWLRWCINESLRLHPPIPAGTRQTAKDVVLPVGGGPDGRAPLLVKEGTNILLNVYCMHRREDIYGPDSELFKPERWEDLKPGWAYLPFNAGPRICMGQQFALSEASYIVVRMAQAFEQIEARDPSSYIEFYTIALFSKNGVQVGLKYA